MSGSRSLGSLTRIESIYRSASMTFLTIDRQSFPLNAYGFTAASPRFDARTYPRRRARPLNSLLFPARHFPNSRQVSLNNSSILTIPSQMQCRQTRYSLVRRLRLQRTCSRPYPSPTDVLETPWLLQSSQRLNKSISINNDLPGKHPRCFRPKLDALRFDRSSSRENWLGQTSLERHSRYKMASAIGPGDATPRKHISLESKNGIEHAHTPSH